MVRKYFGLLSIVDWGNPKWPKKAVIAPLEEVNCTIIPQMTTTEMKWGR